MRFPKPFFREPKQTWYVKIGKRQISLGMDREEAFRRTKRSFFTRKESRPSRDNASRLPRPAISSSTGREKPWTRNAIPQGGRGPPAATFMAAGAAR